MINRRKNRYSRRVAKSQQTREYVTNGKTSSRQKRERERERGDTRSNNVVGENARDRSLTARRRCEMKIHRARSRGQTQKAEQRFSRIARPATNVLIYVERRQQTKPIRAKITRNPLLPRLERRSRRRTLKSLISAKMILCAKTGGSASQGERERK